ncbi:YceD family protein [Catenovulum sp. 2E275]|uniref:YceD family protein n=1 Tax=Catenovulum sp. 2E275 TaxID=2980497 RepID=UPI0021D3B9EB|nr:YceD family protein [Catenovulum sp. 2E275]MCU4674783.1 YceD family protein [Catenovulum sp. 2E275]
MQKVKMPVELDPVKSAQKRSDFVGIYQLKDLSRLHEFVLSDYGQVEVNLKCTYDEQRLPIMLIDAKTAVEVSCERCGGNLTLDISVNATYTPNLKSTDEDLIPDEYSVIDVNEYGLLDFKALIEDELLLAIPFVPKHPVNECAITEQDMSWGELDKAAQEKPANPFDVLKSLKNPK